MIFNRNEETDMTKRQDVLDYIYNNTEYIINTIYSTDIGDYTK